MTEDTLILVDANDQQIGTGQKQEVHEKGLLHRAFSVFLFRKIEGKIHLLMQKRNIEKYHCGGLWTNTCCSHPRDGETVSFAAERRLREELLIENVEIALVGSFLYKASFANGLIEHEYDYTFVGWMNNDHTAYNKEEIDEIQWCEINFLQKDLLKETDKYTPWFSQAFSLALQYIKQDKHFG